MQTFQTLTVGTPHQCSLFRKSSLVDILANGETVNAARFIEFLNKHLLPVLNPFNGLNSRSVVVLGSYLFVGVAYCSLR